jgi:hypothetical protein
MSGKPPRRWVTPKVPSGQTTSTSFQPTWSGNTASNAGPVTGAWNQVSSAWNQWGGSGGGTGAGGGKQNGGYGTQTWGANSRGHTGQSGSFAGNTGFAPSYGGHQGKATFAPLQAGGQAPGFSQPGFGTTGSAFGSTGAGKPGFATQTPTFAGFGQSHVTTPGGASGFGGVGFGATGGQGAVASPGQFTTTFSQPGGSGTTAFGGAWGGQNKVMPGFGTATGGSLGFGGGVMPGFGQTGGMAGFNKAPTTSFSYGTGQAAQMGQSFLSAAGAAFKPQLPTFQQQQHHHQQGVYWGQQQPQQQPQQQGWGGVSQMGFGGQQQSSLGFTSSGPMFGHPQQQPQLSFGAPGFSLSGGGGAFGRTTPQLQFQQQQQYQQQQPGGFMAQYQQQQQAAMQQAAHQQPLGWGEVPKSEQGEQQKEAGAVTTTPEKLHDVLRRGVPSEGKPWKALSDYDRPIMTSYRHVSRSNARILPRGMSSQGAARPAAVRRYGDEDDDEECYDEDL